MQVREPVARPLDVVAIELLLSASQAFLVGVLMYLAIGIWDDRGVGLGPVAIILAVLGLAVGGSWLYWLFGGVGWPLAAANTPVAMFLGFSLVLGVAGDLVVRVEGIPLLLALAASVYGVVGGVFIDSPRRWRWDQRQKLRDGAEVPLVSPTTQALMAAVPRALPRRSQEPEESSSDLAARIEASTPESSTPSGDVGMPSVDTSETSTKTSAATVSAPLDAKATDDEDETAEDEDAAVDPSADTEDAEDTEDTGPWMPTDRLAGTEKPDADDDDDDDGGIELPTAVEPRAQRSPWAWAAPPEWNRDEDDHMNRDSSDRK